MSTLQSYIYKDLQPKVEEKDTPESHLLLVHIPDGFELGDIGARVEYDFGRVRVFGEKSIGSNQIIRFNEKYQVPSHCDIGNMKGKVNGKVVTITMPKIPSEVPQERYEQHQVTDVETKEGATSQEAQNGQEENSQITKVDSKRESQTEISQNESTSEKSQDEISQKESMHTPQKRPEEISKKESTPENGQEEISQKECIRQEGEKYSSQKSQFTKVESKEKAYDETSTPSKATQGEEKIQAKDAKLQTEENTSNLTDENKEKQRVVEKETKETKDESKGSAIGETIPPKGGDEADEKKSDKKGIDESTRTKRIKDMALSTTQAMTSFAKRFNEEDKHMLIYTGATILVVALGVYASVKYRSSRT